MNSQTLILGRITAQVEATENVMLVDDREYGNTGTLRSLDTVTLEQIAAVTYSFQAGYCQFVPDRRRAERIASLWYGESAEGKADWVCGDIPELVNSVVNYLTTRERT